MGNIGAGSFDEADTPALAGTGGGAASACGGGTARSPVRRSTCGGGAFQTGNLHPPSLVQLESYALPCLCFIHSSTTLTVSGTI